MSDGDDTILRLIEGRQLGLDGIVGVGHGAQEMSQIAKHVEDYID